MSLGSHYKLFLHTAKSNGTIKLISTELYKTFKKKNHLIFLSIKFILDVSIIKIKCLLNKCEVYYNNKYFFKFIIFNIKIFFIKNVNNIIYELLIDLNITLIFVLVNLPSYNLIIIINLSFDLINIILNYLFPNLLEFIVL